VRCTTHFVKSSTPPWTKKNFIDLFSFFNSSNNILQFKFWSLLSNYSRKIHKKDQKNRNFLKFPLHRSKFVRGNRSTAPHHCFFLGCRARPVPIGTTSTNFGTSSTKKFWYWTRPHPVFCENRSTAPVRIQFGGF
jgi:hypothetical protein